MPGFVSDDELGQRLRILLKIPASDERPDWWDIAIADANQAACNEVISRLGNRGLSVAQIGSWNRGREYQIDIGLYWLGLKGSVNEEYDTKDLPKLNRGAEIDTPSKEGVMMYLTDSVGTPLIPQTRSLVSHGRTKPGTGRGAEEFRNPDGSWKRW